MCGSCLVFAVKSGAFFAMTTGIPASWADCCRSTLIWQLGPYKPSHVSAGSQPDFYMMWTEGLARIFPPWEIYIGHHHSGRILGRTGDGSGVGLLIATRSWNGSSPATTPTTTCCSGRATCRFARRSARWPSRSTCC